MVSESNGCLRLELAETDAAGFFGTDFHVAQGIAGNDDDPSLLIRQAKLAALGNGCFHNFGNGVGVLVGFQDDFAANILYADLNFQCGASQPIKIY